MADGGKRVVLRADREVQRSVADPRRERGGEIADARLHRHTGIVEHARGPGARLLLFELQLGMRVDAMTEADEHLFLTCDRCTRVRLEIHATSVALCSTPTQRSRH